MNICLKQRSPTPGPQTSTVLGPLGGKWAGQQEVSGGMGESSKPLSPSLPIRVTTLITPLPHQRNFVIHETGSWLPKGWGCKSNVLYYSGINCCYCYCYYIKHLDLNIMGYGDCPPVLFLCMQHILITY